MFDFCPFNADEWTARKGLPEFQGGKSGSQLGQGAFATTYRVIGRAGMTGSGVSPGKVRAFSILSSGSSSSQHRWTPELILQKGHASFRTTSGHSAQKDRGRNRLMYQHHEAQYNCRVKKANLSAASM